MNVGKSKCNNCEHREVCSYKENYNSAYEAITKIYSSNSFSAELSCKHYKREKSWDETRL